MNYKVLKWQILRGSLARRLFLKAFLFALAMAIIPFIQIAHDLWTVDPFVVVNFRECNLNLGSNVFPRPASPFLFPLFGSALLRPFKESEVVTSNVFKKLMEMDLLSSGARAMCVGEGSSSAVLALEKLGFSYATGVDRHPFFSLFRKRFVYELNFEDNYFDFVFSRAVDRVSVPALLVKEIERVLRPGGTGAMLVGAGNFYSGALIRSATPVSLFLKVSNVVHVCGIGPFTLVIFKKKITNVASFEHYRLPDECPAVLNNKPYIKFLEPLAGKNLGQLETELPYLPKFMNMSLRNRLIYVNIGAGEFVSHSIAKIFKPHYPIQPQGFNVYVVDHDTSVLSSYVNKPGVTFVYHPGLAKDKAASGLNSDGDLSAPIDEGFDFIPWLKEIIEDGDFTVLVMNAKVAELKILFELFESGAICYVDEIFLRCSDSVDCKNAVCGDCTSLFKSLRNSGVFVHQWWGD